MIEVAKFEDVKEVIKLSLRIPKDLGIEGLPPVDIEKVSKVFYEQFEQAPIFVYRENGEIVGFVALAIEEFWWSKKPMVHDFAFYVVPGHRKLEIINALLGAMRDFAKINKMPVVSHVLSGERTESKQKLFERQEFSVHGFIATHGI